MVSLTVLLKNEDSLFQSLSLAVFSHSFHSWRCGEFSLKSKMVYLPPEAVCLSYHGFPNVALILDPKQAKTFSPDPFKPRSPSSKGGVWNLLAHVLYNFLFTHLAVEEQHHHVFGTMFLTPWWTQVQYFPFNLFSTTIIKSILTSRYTVATTKDKGLTAAYH